MDELLKRFHEHGVKDLRCINEGCDNIVETHFLFCEECLDKLPFPRK